MPKIYTKTGDKGKTSLYNGERVLKTNAIFDCLGMIDTCNAFIGLSLEYLECSDESIKKSLDMIMHDLLNIGSSIATPYDNSTQELIEKTRFNPKNMDFLESEIDRMVLELPPLNNFILCGGGKFSAHIHIARTSVRSLERLLWKIDSTTVELTEHNNISKYVNRLSDYLFTLARYYSINIKGYSGDIIHMN